VSTGGALAAALRLLARRERSEAELSERLRRKGFDAQAVEAALERCRQLGYLDDGRFALERTRALMRNGRAVGRKVLADLKKYGISEPAALDALQQVGREFDQETLLADLMRRRFPDFVFATADERERRRVIHFFLRRGFPLSRVLTFLKTE